MAKKTVVLVGTRKGVFLLESDEARRDWQVRGPLCESWPIYHAIHDPSSGTIYAAGASEWHGASVWRSTDLGETWQQSSEGLKFGDGNGDGGLKLSKISGLTAANGRIFAGAENPGVFESRDGGATWSLLSTVEGHPDRPKWNDPENQPPGHLGVPAILQHPDDPKRWFAGSFQPSLPGWPASVLSSDHVTPPSRLSKMPTASAPASSRPCAAVSPETFDSFRSPSSP